MATLDNFAASLIVKFEVIGATGGAELPNDRLRPARSPNLGAVSDPALVPR
jgi:hypothetical protein